MTENHTSSVAAAKAALSNIKRQLNATLRDQLDTTQVRADLIAAQEQLAAAEAAERSDADAARAAHGEAEAAAILVAHDAAVAAVAEAVQAIDVAPTWLNFLSKSIPR